MAAQLDLATLTPADVLDLAILIEEEARQRYLELIDLIADSGGDDEALAFFEEMVRHEREHAHRLLERRDRLYPETPPRLTAEVLEELGGVEEASATAMLGLRPGLEAAMAAERRAEGFFRRVAREVRDSEVRRLFEELAEEEVAHQKLIAARLASTP